MALLFLANTTIFNAIGKISFFATLNKLKLNWNLMCKNEPFGSENAECLICITLDSKMFIQFAGNKVCSELGILFLPQFIKVANVS